MLRDASCPLRHPDGTVTMTWLSGPGSGESSGSAGVADEGLGRPGERIRVTAKGCPRAPTTMIRHSQEGSATAASARSRATAAATGPIRPN